MGGVTPFAAIQSMYSTVPANCTDGYGQYVVSTANRVLYTVKRICLTTVNDYWVILYQVILTIIISNYIEMYVCFKWVHTLPTYSRSQCSQVIFNKKYN